MKKLLFIISASLIATWAVAQNCETTLPGSIKAKKLDGTHVQDGDALWICENITFDIIGESNTVYVEKGGDITITGDNQSIVFMKFPGTLTINSDNSSYKVDTGVVVNDYGNSNIIDICYSPKNIIYRYDNIMGITGCIDTSTVGIITPLINRHLKLYPNPVNNVLYVDIPDDAGFSTYKIYSVSGIMVLSGEVSYNSSQIDMSSVDRGLYFIEIENSLGRVSKRISVE